MDYSHSNSELVIIYFFQQNRSITDRAKFKGNTINLLENPLVQSKSVLDDNLPIKGSCLAIVNSTPDELMASSSGGAFSLIARAAIERSGVVYGHAYASPTRVECIRIDDVAELSRLRGSKYVQSDMGISMRNVLDDLRANREVVFSGTPCQVAGLKAYLGKKKVETSGLLLVDIVCHGVPSPEFFADCMEWETRGSHLDEVRFRDKQEGWGCEGSITTTTTIPILHRSITREGVFSPKTSFYYKRFLSGDIYRESCYRCPYAGGFRPGDITLGDFWGIDHEVAGLSPRKGISLAIANTSKGVAALQVAKSASQWAERSIEEAVAGNDQLHHPTPRTASRDKVLADWKTLGIAALEIDYRRKTAWERRTWLVKHAMKKLLKGMLRR